MQEIENYTVDLKQVRHSNYGLFLISAAVRPVQNLPVAAFGNVISRVYFYSAGQLLKI